MAWDHAMKQFGDIPSNGKDTKMLYYKLEFSTLGEEISQKVSHKVLYVMTLFRTDL